MLSQPASNRFPIHPLDAATAVPGVTKSMKPFPDLRHPASTLLLTTDSPSGAKLTQCSRPSFSAMQQGKAGTALVYAVFDVLEIDGVPVVDLPLEERRARLEQLLDTTTKGAQQTFTTAP